MNSEMKIQITTALLMSGAMSLVLSGFFTWLSLGFTSAWLATWAQGFAIGWPTAFILSMVLGKPLRRVASALVS